MYRGGYGEKFMSYRTLGIIGTGRIASRFIKEVDEVEGIEIVAIYNPNFESSKKFAEKYDINFYTDCIEEFLKRIDCVYIASPHQTHFGYIKVSLENEKHVLCEKPMVLNKREAEIVYELANKKHCILLEAIKTAFCPGFLAIMQLVRQNIIGDIKDVEATFTKLENINSRELTDVMYGGCFTELASYTLLPIIKILGIEYKNIFFQQLYNDKNIDIYTKAYLTYEDAYATSKTGLGVKSEGQLLISGTKGYILVRAPWWKTKHIEVCFENTSNNISFDYEYSGEGLRYEIKQFVDLINGQNINQVGIIREESIALAGMMENFLKKEGIFDGDGTGNFG